MLYCVPKNNYCLASNTNSLPSSTDNETDIFSNELLTTNNEKPVSLKLQLALPAQGPIQVSIDHITEYTMCLVHVHVAMCILPFML